MWKNLILEIGKIENSFNDKLNTPATNTEVHKLRERVKKSFNVDLPSEYEEFLKTVNGLDFNGLVIYGVDLSLLEAERDEQICGLIDTNEIWYENEWQKIYLFLGDSNIAWFCKNLSDGTYLELDKPSGTVMETYNDFNTMLEEALKTTLL
ncbi:SMI1/KNR4 family protein [Bacillus pseudomycoides]|uniref:SMI1/KNR4 family protein n=1 Tax=Bacillus pseudomycoides TaxID=64104 RepID=A0AA91VEX2_9BACI|nr:MULTISPECIES: YrhA family protein [Bacillus]PEB52245.1 SMI1/KNR4 family protein [Bacillus sp. AFS098217]PED84077.1 SMI1/KNR4 family protein [Bacillus pseudomycoides]PEU11662.1 SMI1/KNR4 family protein [Bacillus sp. AFS019443]PEU12833.1 SMI1/KNR4 family protein [Bacillus sp. AFS014408]PFW64728.1 SMI1/KNR4 family protein [Bacillus sp. AFS075034]